MQIYFHSCLWSYLPRVPILVEDTVYIMQTKTFILDVINHLTTLLLLVVFATGPGYIYIYFFFYY